MAHRDLEVLPCPVVLATVHVLHDELDLGKAFLRLPVEVVLADLVPVVARDLVFETTRLDRLQPFVDRKVLLRVTDKARGVLPLGEDLLQIKWLELESVKHGKT